MCENCSNSSFLSCETFGVWFYVLIEAIVLIVCWHGVKIKKNRNIRGMELSEPLTDDTKYKDAS
jgi:hypothetical protein